MPELPEVESVRRSLERDLVGRRIEAVRVRDRRLRVPVDTAALEQAATGREVLRVRRRAKFLLVDLGEAPTVLVHLGMTGRLSLVPRELPLAKHDHVIFALDDGRDLRFNDARRFGLVSLVEAGAEADHPALAGLGVEPLEAAFDGAALYALTRGVARPIKNLIMDGNRLVGVGNIYASESLFRAGIHPAAPAGRLSKPRLVRLARAIRDTLRAAIAQGGTTFRDFSNTGGELGYFSVRLRVYGREGEPCVRCGGRIRRIVQSGRSTFYCGACQRR
jgi:formamidopyrimidine-DNA glycosylase